MITWKIKYTCNDDFKDYLIQYNNILRFTYNRIYENKELKTKEITKLQKSMSNQNLINSHLLNSCIYDCKTLIKDKKDKQIIFGGKQNFLDRCKKKITKEKFKEKRLCPLYSVGETDKKGNRLFKIIDENTILFKPDRKHHYILNLQEVGIKRSKEIKKLIELQNNKALPITYKLDLSYVYISFDYNYLKTYTYKVKQNRVIAIDLNPNNIGWSVVDWFTEDKYNILQSGTFSLKPLNDYRDSKSVASNSDFHKYITNKRKHEIIEITKQLFKLCRYYHCEIFSIEDLNMKVSDKKLGHRFNKLVNNYWNRNLLVNQIRKHINSSSTTLIEVQPQYNSYIGNLVFRQEHLPDECLASIEIGRRGYEFAIQYIFNRRPHQKTVIYPKLELVKNQLTLSLEELGIDVPNFNSWKDILSVVKESKVKYRFSASDAKSLHSEGLFSKFYKYKYLLIYTYL